MADYTGNQTAYNGHVLYEGRPSGAANDPIGTVGDIVFNAGYDALDTAEGFKTMANATTARMADMVPWTNHPSQSPIRSEDAQLIPQIAQSVIGNYQHSYVDPIIQGRPLDIARHFIAHPLNAGLDVNAAASLTHAPQLLRGLASKSAIVQDATEAANQIKDKAINKLVPEPQRIAQKMSQEFKQGVLAEDTAFHNELGKAWNQIPRAMQGDVQAYAEGWHTALHAGQPVPPEIAQYLQKAENYAAIMRQRIEPMARSADLALDKYQPATMKLRGLGTDQWKAMTRDQQLGELAQTKAELAAKGIDAQYSPHVTELEAAATINHPTKFPKSGIKDKLKAKSNEIILAGLREKLSKLQKQYTDAVSANAEAKILTGIQERIADAEKEISDVLSDKAGFAMTKQTSGETAIKSHYNSMRTRWIQISQFQNAYDKILQAAIDMSENLETLKNAPDAGAKQIAQKTAEDLLRAGYHPISGKDLVDLVLAPLKGAVMSEEELAYIADKIAPGEIFMPQSMSAALEVAVKQRSYSTNPLVRVYDGNVTMSKRYTLGGKITYGPAQGIQAMAMCDFVCMNGIRSALAHVTAYYMVTKSAVRNAVPLSIAENVLANTVSTNRNLENAVNFLFDQTKVATDALGPQVKAGLEAMQSVTSKTPKFMQAPLKGSVAAYENFIDFNLRLGAFADSIIRAKAAIAEAYLEASQNTAFGEALRGMFDSAKMVAAVDTKLADPETLARVSKKINDALGNFKEIADNGNVKALGRIVPFPTWMIFITKYTLSLPKNHPYKTVLLNNIAQMQDRYVANKNVPSYLKGAVSMYGLGPNGQPQVMRKEGMNPLTSVGEIYSMAEQFFTGQGDTSLISAMTAPIQMGFILMTKLNPMDLKPYQDRGLVKTDSGKLYKKEDAAQGLIERGLAQEQKPTPDPLTLAMRAYFPVQERHFEAALEKIRSGGAKSSMSTLFHSAPKLNRATGGDKKAPDWISMFVQALIDAAPIEYDPNAKLMEEKQRFLDQRSAYKQIARMNMQP